VDQRVGVVHPIPELRRGNLPGHLLDQRDRESELKVPPLHPGVWTLP
jgi:hypothetical protein